MREAKQTIKLEYHLIFNHRSVPDTQLLVSCLHRLNIYSGLHFFFLLVPVVGIDFN
jgi:hypothetical protein